MRLLKDFFVSKKSLITRLLIKKKINQTLFNTRKILTLALKKNLMHKDYSFLIKHIQKLKKNSSRHKLNNYCFHTGRINGFNTFFGLSRLTIREWGHNKILPGIRKGSW